MKKILSVILVLSMILAAAACGKKNSGADEPAFGDDSSDVISGVPNPMTEYTSLDEINEKYGVHLHGPAAMGVNDESFFGIEGSTYGLAEYNFAIGGYEYCFRGTQDTFEDISGLNTGNGTAFASEIQGQPQPDAFYADDDYKSARWYIGTKQYVLTVKDGGEMDQADFETIVEELKGLTDVQ